VSINAEESRSVKASVRFNAHVSELRCATNGTVLIERRTARASNSLATGVRKSSEDDSGLQESVATDFLGTVTAEVDSPALRRKPAAVITLPTFRRSRFRCLGLTHWHWG
jgi:hypothetical protein